VPSWRIEFVVTHKYYADAQAALYAIRGISDVRAQPIADGSPSSKVNGAHVNGKTAKVEQLINRRPKFTFNANEVAELTGDTPKLAGQTLAYLATNKRIRRIGAGKFQALKAK